MEAYLASNDHCNVPRGYKVNPALRKWVNTQHTAIKKGTLQPDQVAHLNAIGFQADPLNQTWNGHFTKLMAYLASNGHSNVPRDYAADLVLGGWVSNQRAAIKNDTLQPDQVTRLDMIGFKKDHASNDQNWIRHFTKLVSYRESNGHCNVPQGYKADPVLGRWVDKQRTTIKKGTRKLD